MRVQMSAARKNAGLTQVQMAEKLGVSYITVLDWEKGRRPPRADKLDKYCEICGCTREDIILPWE